MPVIDFHPQMLDSLFIQDLKSYGLNKQGDIFQSQHLEKEIEQTKTKINALLQSLQLSLTNFEYSRDIHSMKGKEKEMWSLRHQLVFQVLHFVYATVFDESKLKDFSDNKRSFVADISKAKPNIKIGIFGAKTLTSDIDISFQVGSLERIPGVLSLLVAVFEDAFLKFTGRNSLSFDIEAYGELMYIDLKEKTLYFLDTYDFSMQDLNEIISSIGAGIIRNFINTQLHLKNIVRNIRRFNAFDVNVGPNAISLDSLITGFDFNFDEIKFLKSTLNNSEFLSIFDKPEWMKTSKLLVSQALKSYDETRETYYQKLNEAENLLSSNPNLMHSKSDKSVRIKLMNAIAVANLFRAESYVSSATNYHVVQKMQRKEVLENADECDLYMPKRKAQCALGTVGHIISMLEQCGFLMRYRKVCDVKEPKCIKKIDKYLIRFLDAFNGIVAQKYRRTILTPPPVPSPATAPASLSQQRPQSNQQLQQQPQRPQSNQQQHQRPQSNQQQHQQQQRPLSQQPQRYGGERKTKKKNTRHKRKD